MSVPFKVAILIVEIMQEYNTSKSSYPIDPQSLVLTTIRASYEKHTMYMLHYTTTEVDLDTDTSEEVHSPIATIKWDSKTKSYTYEMFNSK